MSDVNSDDQRGVGPSDGPATGPEETAPASGGDGRDVVAEVVTALHTVYDPEIPVDIYELGLIYDVQVDGAGKIAVKMTLTAPGCPVADVMPVMVEDAILSQVEGVAEVDVEIVWDPPWEPSRMSEAARLELGML